MTKPTLEQRFWKFVEKTESCWLWRGYRDKKKGYGMFNVEGTPIQSHRVAWTLLIGPLTSKDELHHECPNKACIRPDPKHVVKVLRHDNPDCPSYLNRHKSHCKNGHPLSGSNLYERPGRRHRCCRICVNDRQRERRQRLGVGPGPTGSM